MTGLFGHDDTCRVRFFCYTKCCAVTQTVVLRDLGILANRQDACCSYHSSFANHECTIVEGGVFKEDILYESCGHLGIEFFTGIDDLFEGVCSGEHDEGSGFGGRHMAASLGYLEDLLTGRSIFFGVTASEELDRGKARPDTIEEHTYFFLEDNDEGECSDGDDPVEEGTGQFELEDESDEEPYDDEGEDAPEETGGSGAAQQDVCLVEDGCYEQDIDEVFEPERESQKMHID